MPKVKISEYSTVNSNNTDINSINIDEGCAPSGINNAIREVMVHLKNWQTNASGDGATFASLVVQGTGSFTGAVTMSAGATLSGTNTLSGSNIMSGNINSSGSTNTFSGTVVMSGANTISHAAGTVSAPSITVNGDSNTGIFFPAADTIAFAEGGAEAMRIDSNGMVGIGITPAQTSGLAIELGGSANNNAINFLNSANCQGWITSNAYYNGTNWLRKYAGGTTVTAYTTNDQGCHVWRYAAASTAGSTISWSEAMRIDSSGNVGIGTTSPGNILELKAATPIAIFNQTTSNSNQGIQFQFNGSTYGRILNNAATGILDIRNGLNNGDGYLITFSTDGTERARIDSSGNFYVKNMAVGGTANLHWSSGNGQFFVTSSSRRFKHDITDYNKGLAEVMQMQPKYFVYNEEPGQKQRVGFIAEDFHDLGMTEFVEYWKDENDQDTPSEIGYSNMVAILVKSIQELKAITDAQATRIEALEAEVAAMKAGNGN